MKTAAKLAAEMRALGFEVTEKVGGTGLVAIYRNGPGPTVMVRTELDALPMEEKTELAYASRVKTNGTVARASSPTAAATTSTWRAGSPARALVGLKDQWKGTLMFIGQPAEEIV